jgi:uncharacterized protein (DUF488 family)
MVASQSRPKSTRIRSNSIARPRESGDPERPSLDSRLRGNERRKSQSKSAPLFTIGYEKATPQAFFDELKKAKVELVVDTRAVAASRRPGFSKKQLAAGLDENGIGYIHLQKLGTPTEGREAARSGDLAKLWKIYAKHIKTPDAQEALDELFALLKPGKRVCLLCYERDPNECHRSRIAEIIVARTGMRVDNLIPPLF